MNTGTYTLTQKELEKLVREAISSAASSSVSEKEIADNGKPGGSNRKGAIMENESVYGPYKMGRKFRLVFKGPLGQQRYQSFSTEKEALAELAKYKGQGGISVEACIDMYDLYLREKGNKARTIATTLQRLKRLFQEHLNTPLGSIREEKRLLEGLASLSFDTRSAIVNETKTFLRWCVSQGYIKTSFLEGTKLLGKKKRGKPQLRITEARKLTQVATTLAKNGDKGAVAVLMTLLMGLRASEVLNRVVRDLDDNYSLLWITEAKTVRGNRTLIIPEVLQAPLSQLASNKESHERLFGTHDRSWLWRQVKRLCQLAGVPIINPHGMRGTHASLAVEAGTSSQIVAAALGHESFTTTARHYATPESVEGARQQAAVSRLFRQ